jgi:hypothetical protein
MPFFISSFFISPFLISSMADAGLVIEIAGPESQNF